MYKNTQIIAEVKTQSPFASRATTENGADQGVAFRKSWGELFELAQSVGDIISIHTDARWGGSFDLLKKARGLTDKPILAKGIHATDDEVARALEIGADYVLVVGRVPNISMLKGAAGNSGDFQMLSKCLIEPLDLENMKAILKEVQDKFQSVQNLKLVWNSRDLKDGSIKTETFEQARDLFKGWMCQASNIKTVKDIYSDTDAILVGTNLEEFAESLESESSQDEPLRAEN